MLGLTVTGDTQAAAKFRTKRERAPRELKNAMKRGATIMARELRSRVRRKSGLLYKSIGSKVHENRRGKLTALAGPRRGFRVTVRTIEARKLTGTRAAKKGDRKIVLKRGRRIGQGQTVDPVRYAHLAGPGRKQDFMQPANAAAQPKVKAEVREAMVAIGRA